MDFKYDANGKKVILQDLNESTKWNFDPKNMALGYAPSLEIEQGNTLFTIAADAGSNGFTVVGQTEENMSDKTWKDEMKRLGFKTFEEQYTEISGLNFKDLKQFIKKLKLTEPSDSDYLKLLTQFAENVFKSN